MPISRLTQERASGQHFGHGGRNFELREYKIKLLGHKKNKGLNQTLNDCLKVASGEYIGRMDADDISLPTRFEKEIAEFKSILGATF